MNYRYIVIQEPGDDLMQGADCVWGVYFTHIEAAKDAVRSDIPFMPDGEWEPLGGLDWQWVLDLSDTAVGMNYIIQRVQLAQEVGE